MGPADLMDYDYNKIRGLIIEDGTPTMHVAIVAKALNIPVIAKIKGVFNDIKTGDNLAVDGNEGYVYMSACLLIWTIPKPPTATASVCIVPKFLLWLPM